MSETTIRCERGKDFQVEDPVNLTGFSRDDYEFLGWSTDKNAEKPEYGGIFMPLAANFTQDTTLYAIWKKVHCTIVFDAAGGEFNIGFTSRDGKYIGLQPFTPEDGYDITVTDGKVVGVTKTIIRGHELGEIPYVKWEYQDGDDLHRFMLVCWANSPLGNDYISRFTRFDEDTTVYAHWYEDNTANEWRPEYVTVTFDPRGGTLSIDSATMTVLKGAKINPMPTATQSGKTFKGWFDKVDASGAKEITNEKVIGKDTTAYAHWQ